MAKVLPFKKVVPFKLFFLLVYNFIIEKQGLIFTFAAQCHFIYPP